MNKIYYLLFITYFSGSVIPPNNWNRCPVIRSLWLWILIFSDIDWEGNHWCGSVSEWVSERVSVSVWVRVRRTMQRVCVYEWVCTTRTVCSSAMCMCADSHGASVRDNERSRYNPGKFSGILLYNYYIILSINRVPSLTP